MYCSFWHVTLSRRWQLDCSCGWVAEQFVTSPRACQGPRLSPHQWGEGVKREEVGMGLDMKGKTFRDSPRQKWIFEKDVSCGRERKYAPLSTGIAPVSHVQLICLTTSRSTELGRHNGEHPGSCLFGVCSVVQASQKSNTDFSRYMRGDVSLLIAVIAHC
jgi:hypothetical protein